MSDLTDEELKLWSALVPLASVPYDPAAIQRMARELQRHRAMVKRLDEWAEQLEAKRDSPVHVGRFIAAELRNRMRTP